MPRILIALDPEADARARFAHDFMEGKGWNGALRVLWADKDERALPAGFAYATSLSLTSVRPILVRERIHDDVLHPNLKVLDFELAFQSLPDLPKDPWGHRWFVRPGTYRGTVLGGSYWSAGPNGKFEWGDEGTDDISLDAQDAPPRTWWKVVAGAVALLVLHAARRCAYAERSRSIVVEGARALSIAVPFIVLAVAILAWAQVFLDPSWFTMPAQPWTVVTPKTAAFLSCGVVIWVVVLVLRLRKASPPGTSTNDGTTSRD